MRKYLLIIFYITIGSCYSQQYPIQKLTPLQGLAQSQVYGLLKDSRGIIWTGTYGGLSRFNGEYFTNYTTKDGLISDFVSGIYEDSHGYIWARCGYSYGLVRFDGKTFKKYLFPKNATVTDVEFASNNVILIGIDHKIYHIEKDTIVPYSQLNSILSQYPKYVSFRYFKKLNSFIFILEDNNAYILKENKLAKIILPESVYSIVQEFDDQIVFRNNHIQSSTATYYIWDGADCKLFMRLALDKFEVYTPLKHDFTFSTSKGLFFLPKNTIKAHYLSKKPPLTYTSFHNQPDGETLWLPTEKGLWRMTRRGFKQFTEEQVPYCWGIVEDKYKNLYFENYDVSLMKFDRKSLSIIPDFLYTNALLKAYIKVGSKNIGGAANAWYYKPLRDKYQNLWFPNAVGLFRYDYKNWKVITHNKGDALAFCISEDKKRDRVVACGYNQLYTVDTQMLDNVNFIKDTAKIFQGLISSVIVSPTSDYWFTGYGVGCYNPNTRMFKYYNYNNKKLPTNGILGVYFDWKGRLWAMGWTDGLYLYNSQKDAFEPIMKEYFTSAINFVEQIDNEHLMVGTVNGLHVINLNKFFKEGKVEIKVYNYHNGYMGIEPGQLGSYRDSEGYIWVTSSTVLTRINPKELNFTPRLLKTFIVKVGKENVKFIENNETVKLPNGINTTTFIVESIGEDKPFKSQYSFRIEGFINDWSEWQEQNLIMVNNLPNGLHTIEVRSRTGNLSSTESSITKLQFYVSAPFYKSPNFYKYASLLGLFLIITISYLWKKERNQKNKIDKQQQKLKKQENKVRFLQVQTIQAQMNPHFTFNVLGTIQHLILNNEMEKANQNILKLSILIRNYLESSLIGDEKNGSLFKHEILFSKEVELLKMYVEFEQLQYNNRFDYELTVDGQININNYRVPPLIIQPFVENAIKHGLLYKKSEEKGFLSIRFVGLSEDVLICTIEDDGVGRIKAAEIQAKSIKKYKSRGTDLVKRRVEILNEVGYDIEILTEDRLGGGTVVTIKIGYK